MPLLTTDGVEPVTTRASGVVLTIRPAGGWFDVDLLELWSYRDLILLLVRRDFVAQYAQTILGPAWFVLQPVLTTAMFTLVFNRVAQIPTDGLPPYLFYMAGIVAWNYFATCLTRTSTTFAANAHIFGKVWFPRLAVPVAVVIGNLFTFLVQFVLLGVLIGVEIVRGRVAFPGGTVVLVPVLVAVMGVLGLGCGLVISSLTTKYRDLVNLVTFGVQLWMFATPVVYPASRIPVKWEWLMLVNPMAPIVEGFRALLLGSGSVSAVLITASALMAMLTLVVGAGLFSRTEKSFMDSV